MIRNNFKIAIRNLFKQSSYAVINIGGLAIGIACSFVILLYVFQELSYEKHFKDHHRIYRVATKFMSMGTFANGPEIFLDVFPQEYPWVEQFCRVSGESFEIIYRDYTVRKEGLYVDPEFFNMFPYQFESGNPSTAMDNENSVVISLDLAMDLFGNDEALGMIIELGEDEDKAPFLVTGVVDIKNVKSHLNSNLWIRKSISNEQTSGFDDNWISIATYNYIKVNPGISLEDIQNSLDKTVEKHVFPNFKSTSSFEDWFQRDDAYRLIAQPLDDIYLKGTLSFDISAGGNATTVNVLLAIAILIILIASVNFINLSTARATRRAKEVGIKKTMGSTRINLVFQFISESVMTSLVATVFAFGIAELLLLAFGNLTGQVLIDSSLVTVPNIVTAVVLALFIGIIAGIYPAFYLSSFRPSLVLKGGYQSAKGNKGFRNILVVFQFSLSIILIICSLIIFQQLQFMKTKDLGFNKEDLLIVDNTRKLENNFQPFKNSLAARSEVIKMSSSQRLPGSSSTFSITTLQSEGQEEGVNMNRFGGDVEYIETLGFDIIAGRNFSREIASDSNAVILNQSAVRALELENPVGSILNEELTVIGVVRDFNFESLRKKIEPVVITLSDSKNSIAIKVNLSQAANLITFLQNEWNSYSLAAPIQYHFLDDNFKNLMKNDTKMSQVVTMFTVLAIFISCLGLFGLSAYVANQRKKEIGIRKVLGATISNILIMLNQEFIKLVLLAVIFAVPVSAYVMNNWLANFAYRINLTAGMFILSGLITLAIALITVSYQSLAAATSDPVDSLMED